MQPEIIEKPGFNMLGICVTAHFSELGQKIPAAWKDYFEIENLVFGDHAPELTLEYSQSGPDGVYTEWLGRQVELPAKQTHGLDETEVPTALYVHGVHEGPLTRIAQSFGELIEFAENNDFITTGVKLDFGYQPNLSDARHDLFVGVRR